MNGDDVSDLTELFERFRQKDRQALARLLSHATQSEGAEIIRTQITPRPTGSVIALTGNGGVGKSSLVGRIAERLRKDGIHVAVLACDPESPYTGGALLGDRIRMSPLASDPGLFIRSVATSGGRQAVAENLDLMCQLLLEYGFEIVLIETVGAGQADVAVRELADILVLLVQPETGDELQWEKAGLLEVADVVVVNKADLPGADTVMAQLHGQLNLPGCRPVPIFKLSATQGEGLDELWRAVQELRTEN